MKNLINNIISKILYCKLLKKHKYGFEPFELGTKYINYHKCKYCDDRYLEFDNVLPVIFLKRIFLRVDAYIPKLLVPYDIPSSVFKKSVLIEKFEEIINPVTKNVNYKKWDDAMHLPAWKEICFLDNKIKLKLNGTFY